VAGTILIWILARSFGIEGAAMGYAATQGLLALSAALLASRTFDLPWTALRQSLTIWSGQVFRSPVQASSTSGNT
jgi:O-antigen/teichoic acid export membrane protein